LSVVEKKWVGKAECRRVEVRQQVSDCRIDLPKLPDIILITKQVDICLNLLKKVKEGVWHAGTLRSVPLDDIEMLARDRKPHDLSSIVGRMVIEPMYGEWRPIRI
jgi:hypothetical protein